MIFDSTCVSCGCHDYHASMTEEGPCYWLRVDEEVGEGVCSGCPEVVDTWDNAHAGTDTELNDLERLSGLIECPWCGADLSEFEQTYGNRHNGNERFCSRSHRDASTRALKQLIGT